MERVIDEKREDKCLQHAEETSGHVEGKGYVTGRSSMLVPKDIYISKEHPGGPARSGGKVQVSIKQGW